MPGTLTTVDLEAKYPGIVLPAHWSIPRYVRTLGPEVAAVATLAGFNPDPEQLLGLDIAFAIDEDRGKSAASEIAILCCRQNLKTGLIKMIELGWLFVTDERLVVHSAHEFNTAREAYRDLKELIEGCPELAKNVKPGGFKDTPADMSIETVTGARLVFKTRTKGGGRGLSGRKIVLDEAFALKAMHMGALRPLISAQPDPQIIYASSACLEDSEVLHTIVKRGRKGDDPRLGFLEWCMPDPESACADGEACRHVYGVADGCGLDNVEYLKASNPAIGRRIDLETILDERRACVSELLAHEFGRERGGWHDDPVDGVQVIDAEKWANGKDLDSELQPATVAFAFDVQPGNASAAIAAVGRLQVSPEVIAQALELGLDTADLGKLARMRGEITGRAGEIDCRPGVDWLVDRLAEVCRKASAVALGYDPASPAGAFRQALLDTKQFVEVAEDEAVPRGKTRLVAMTGREYGQACGALDADVRNGAFKHYGQKPLDDAVEGARSVPLADLWKWSRKDSSVNIAPLVAVTIARAMCAVYGNRKAKGGGWAMSI